MKFSTKTRYGIRAMLEIAKDSQQGGVFQKDISERQEISNKYLDQIIHALKSEGLITNAKGRKSGYVLTRPPQEISVLDIHLAFENSICIVDCMDLNHDCQLQHECKTHFFWRGLNNLVLDYFKKTSLQNLIDGDFPFSTELNPNA